MGYSFMRKGLVPMAFAALVVFGPQAGPLAAQTVAISNVSYPGTGLEVGDTVGVTITGAAPNGAVTVVANGGSPYYFGTTDGSGYKFIPSTITSSDVGSWSEVWYVNGVALTVVNPNSYLPYAPRLPNFNVYANYTQTNCPNQSAASYCPSSPQLSVWKYSPISYYSYSSTISSSDASAATGNWNAVQSRLSFSKNTYAATEIVDESGGTVNANTYIIGGGCDSCYGYIDLCSSISPGECVNDSGVYGAYIELYPSVISAAASALGTTTELAATITVNHELGHALRLADITPQNGICSEVQSIMYGSLSMLYGCNMRGPNTSCDGNVLSNDVYPSSLATCQQVGTNYCASAQPCP